MLPKPKTSAAILLRGPDPTAFREGQEIINFQRACRVSLNYRFGQAKQGWWRKLIRNDDVKGSVSNTLAGDKGSKYSRIPWHPLALMLLSTVSVPILMRPLIAIF
ncbi:hypothetical protein [Hymenobacter volaticus]|uniref:Uncharacterized protein n=1 Tax=Hymenobacter volaticus TaxID=2932254 RepID=A0ABY4GEQ5_9BACT|nr:hypothetical protein [Hymenobacter volaticus]UOQ69374.1 hypothetical protein MUN86_27160 [Hymenobacter volaticus]